MMSAVRMTKNPHLVYIDDYEDSDDDEVFADKPIQITPRKSCEKYVLEYVINGLFTSCFQEFPI